MVVVVPRALSSEALDPRAAENMTATRRPMAPWGSSVRMKVMKT
jgi:hypothetical protein